MNNKLSTIPLDRFTAGMIIFCAVWFILTAAVRYVCETRCEKIDRRWRMVNLALAAVWAVFVLYQTLLSRHMLAERLLLLRPFNNIVKAFTEPQYSREKLLNLYLFIPLGLTLSCALAATKKQRRDKPSSSRAHKKSVAGRHKYWRKICKLVSDGNWPPHRIILISFCFSLLIEVIQGVAILGTAETDDVLTNTAGAAIGLLVWYLAEKAAALILRKWNK